MYSTLRRARYILNTSLSTVVVVIAVSIQRASCHHNAIYRSLLVDRLCFFAKRLMRDGTAEPVSRDQILRRERGQRNIHFPCSADHGRDWQPCPVDPYSCYMCDHTYILLYRVLRKVRVRGDKEDHHHSSLEHDPESTRDRYSPESINRRSNRGPHKEVETGGLENPPSYLSVRATAHCPITVARPHQMGVATCLDMAYLFNSFLPSTSKSLDMDEYSCSDLSWNVHFQTLKRFPQRGFRWKREFLQSSDFFFFRR